ncbi:hypothetical protein ACQP3J_32770, partial [Escherichia coli]
FFFYDKWVFIGEHLHRKIQRTKELQEHFSAFPTRIADPPEGSGQTESMPQASLLQLPSV